MKSLIAILVVLSGVSIDMPPPGFKMKVATDAGVTSVADAGTPKKLKNLHELRLEARETFKVMEALISADAHKEVKAKSILFAQQNMTDDRDAVIVTFSVKGEEDFSMFFVRKGQDWQPYRDTFGEETP
jgi:hypothetical protein